MIPSLTLNLVDTPDDVLAFKDWIEALDEPVAFDTETTGLKWWTPRFTRLAQWGTRDEGWAVPIDWYGRLVHWAMQRVRDKGLPVIMHNCKFDMHALEGDGYPVPEWRNVHDTMVMHHLLHPHHPHGLKPITTGMFGGWAGAGETILKEAMRLYGYNWDTVPVDCPYYWAYGIVDTILTRRLFDVQRSVISEQAYENEMAYVAIMYRAERRGMRIDVEYCEQLRRAWLGDVQNLAMQLKHNGIENPNSNRLVESALRELGWTPDDYTETGQAQLDKIVLAELKQIPGRIGEIAEVLVEYKRKTKWISTYLDTFINDRDDNDRVHASVRTLGARTGRSSITGPPLQTLPHTAEIRNAVLPYEGEQLWAVDYSGQEYRILAALSQDPAWLHEFRHGAGDPHTMVAEMLGIQRDQAKTFNFAMVYGAGPKKLAASTGLSVTQVQHFLKVYAQRFPQVSEFIQNVQRQGMRQLREGQEPFVTTVGGRKVYGEEDRLFALTNYLIQGSGADVLKQAVIRLDQQGLADHIIVPVHDELVLSLPDHVPGHAVAAIMTDTTSFDLELTAEPEGPFPNWGAKYA